MVACSCPLSLSAPHCWPVRCRTLLSLSASLPGKLPRFVFSPGGNCFLIFKFWRSGVSFFTALVACSDLLRRTRWMKPMDLCSSSRSQNQTNWTDWTIEIISEDKQLQNGINYGKQGMWVTEFPRKHLQQMVTSLAVINEFQRHPKQLYEVLPQ